MKGRKPDISERDALSHVDFTHMEPGESFASILGRVKVVDFAGSVKPEDRVSASQQGCGSLVQKGGLLVERCLPDEPLLLHQMHFIDPSRLLDLKLSEDPKRRLSAEELELLRKLLKKCKDGGIDRL